MKRVLISILSLTLLASCGKVESPESFFDISGPKGKDGQSCHAESAQGGINVICGDNVEFVANGQDGIDGSDGVDGKDGVDGHNGEKGDKGDTGTFEGYIEYRTVCPDVAGDYKEVLLYLDGQYMAYLTSNQVNKQRLVVLVENIPYNTTDGRNVSFKIVNNGTDSVIECL